MKISLLGFLIVLFAFATCRKDKFQTKPQIKLKSVSSEVIPVNGGLKVVIEFTDKEGDVDDSLFVKKRRLNQRVVPTIRDSLRYKIPTFPDKSKGEMEVIFDYQSILSAINPPNVPGSIPPRKESDTLSLKFAVRDKQGNASDTLTIGTIVVLRN